MEEKKTLLILRLEGALQSWGDHSKWDVRDSGDFPSKSGVVGLLSCAMGLERGDPEIAALSAARRLSRVNAQKSKNIFYEARMRAISSRKSCSEHR